MIKQVFLFFQLLIFSIYQLLTAGGASAEQRSEGNLIAGNSIKVEVAINKGNVEGFAKLQQVLPPGFSAEVIESQGATFSAKSNYIKLIWMELPEEQEFVVSYKLIADIALEGEFLIQGEFSFLEDGERKDVKVKSSPIVVTKSGASQEELATEEAIPENDMEETVLDKADEVVKRETAIACVRTVEAAEDHLYKVTLKLDKKNIAGFAKVTERIPSGFTATEDVSKGGSFSTKPGEVKILWMVLPEDDAFEVSYFLKGDASIKSGNYTIAGSTFSYLDNSVTAKYVIAPTAFYAQGSDNLAELTEKKSEAVKESKEAPKENTTKGATAVAKKKETKVPSPEHGITYKVQVAAGHKKVGTNYFFQRFNLKDRISTEDHQGWIKYVLGSFEEYKQARDKRGNVRKNISDAFVTAYNRGRRITVQEALMVSNQRWYK